MNAVTVAVALSSLAVLFSGCASNAGSLLSGPMVEAPQWAAGYQWTHSMEGTVDMDIDAMGHTQAATVPIPASEFRTTVLNTTSAVGGEPVYVLASKGDALPSDLQEFGVEFDLESLLRGLSPLVGAVRQRDLGPVGVRFDCEDSECQLIPMESETEDVTNLDFPLQTGKQWGASFRTTNNDVEMLHTMTSKVTGHSTLAFAGKILPVVLVDQAIHSGASTATLERLRQQFEGSGGDVTKLELLSSTNTRMQYSPEVLTVAQADTESLVHLAVEMTDGDETESYNVDVTITFTQRLQEFALDAGPEIDLSQAKKILEGLVPPPGGPALAATIVSDRDSANAAAHEGVLFEIEGEDLPEDREIQWTTLVSATQEIVDSQSGEVYMARFDSPGVYLVRAEIVDEDNEPIAVAERSFPVDFIGSFPADCEPAALLGVMSGCASLPLPVSPGIQSLVVGVTPSGLAPALTDASMVLATTGDDLRDETSPYELSISDFSAYELEAGEWSLDWDQAQAVAEEATYHVALRYSAEPPMEVVVDTQEPMVAYVLAPVPHFEILNVA